MAEIGERARRTRRSSRARCRRAPAPVRHAAPAAGSGRSGRRDARPRARGYSPRSTPSPRKRRRSCRRPRPVARPRAAAADLGAGRDLADRGQRQRRRPGGRDRIAAEQRRPRRAAGPRRGRARKLATQSSPSDAGSAVVKQIMQRPRAHRRQIGQIDPQQLLGDEVRRIVGQEMDAGDDRVGSHDQPMAGRGTRRAPRRRARPSAARPGQAARNSAGCARTRRARVGGRAGVCRPTSRPARRLRARRSSTPLASPGSLPVKKAWAIAMYSLIDTRGGTSARCDQFPGAGAQDRAQHRVRAAPAASPRPAAAEMSASSRSRSAATPRTISAKKRRVGLARLLAVDLLAEPVAGEFAARPPRRRAPAFSSS